MVDSKFRKNELLTLRCLDKIKKFNDIEIIKGD